MQFISEKQILHAHRMLGVACENLYGLLEIKVYIYAVHVHRGKNQCTHSPLHQHRPVCRKVIVDHVRRTDVPPARSGNTENKPGWAEPFIFLGQEFMYLNVIDLGERFVNN